MSKMYHRGTGTIDPLTQKWKLKLVCGKKDPGKLGWFAYDYQRWGEHLFLFKDGGTRLCPECFKDVNHPQNPHYLGGVKHESWVLPDKPAEKPVLKPLETALYGVNKKTMPTHERLSTVVEPCKVTKSAVAASIEKKNLTYYWDPEYAGDGEQ